MSDSSGQQWFDVVADEGDLSTDTTGSTYSAAPVWLRAKRDEAPPPTRAKSIQDPCARGESMVEYPISGVIWHEQKEFFTFFFSAGPVGVMHQQTAKLWGGVVFIICVPPPGAPARSWLLLCGTIGHLGKEGAVLLAWGDRTAVREALLPAFEGSGQVCVSAFIRRARRKFPRISQRVGRAGRASRIFPTANKSLLLLFIRPRGRCLFRSLTEIRAIGFERDDACSSKGRGVASWETRETARADHALFPPSRRRCALPTTTTAATVLL